MVYSNLGPLPMPQGHKITRRIGEEFQAWCADCYREGAPQPFFYWQDELVAAQADLATHVINRHNGNIAPLVPNLWEKG